MNCICSFGVPRKHPICQTSEKPRSAANIQKPALLGHASNIFQKEGKDLISTVRLTDAMLVN